MKRSLIEKIVREELKKKIKNLVKEADAKADARMISRHTSSSVGPRQGQRRRSEAEQRKRDKNIAIKMLRNLYRSVKEWVDELPFKIGPKELSDVLNGAKRVSSMPKTIGPRGGALDEARILDYLRYFITNLERARDSKIESVKQKYADEPEKTLEYRVLYIKRYFDDEIKKWSDLRERLLANIKFLEKASED